MCKNGCFKCSNGEQMFCPLIVIGPKKYPKSRSSLTEEENAAIDKILDEFSETLKRLSK